MIRHPLTTIRNYSFFVASVEKDSFPIFLFLRQNRQLFQQQKQQQQQRRRDIRHNGTKNNDVLHIGLNCYVQYQSIHQNVMLSAAFLMVMLSVQLFLVSEY